MDLFFNIVFLTLIFFFFSEFLNDETFRPTKNSRWGGNVTPPSDDNTDTVQEQVRQLAVDLNQKTLQGT